MAKMSMKLQGGKALLRELRKLDKAVGRKIMRKALREGAKVIQKEAQARAPVDTGLTRSAIKVRAAKRLRRGSVGVNVSIGAGDYKGETFYASFIEYGYDKQQTIRLPNGTFVSLPRGQGTPTPISPRPFVRPAFDAKADDALRAIREQIRRGIDAAVKRK